MEINQITPQLNTMGSSPKDSNTLVDTTKESSEQRQQVAANEISEAKRQKEIESKYAISETTKAMDMEEMAKELQGLADSLGRSVKFSVNEESGDEVIMVFHKKTKELIRQIPSEEIVELRDRLSKVFGSLIEERI